MSESSPTPETLAEAEAALTAAAAALKTAEAAAAAPAAPPVATAATSASATPAEGLDAWLAGLRDTAVARDTGTYNRIFAWVQDIKAAIAAVKES